MRTKITFVLAAMTALLAGCGEGATMVTAQTATLTLAITDGPITDAQKVWISVAGVEVKPASGAAIAFDFATPKGFDLLQLRNGNAASLLGESVVPAGPYEWIRVKVDIPGSYIIDSTGSQRSLTMPSAAETGLKLVRGFTMPAGGRADFTIDFVLSKSVTFPQGQGGNFLFKPVLRLVDNIEVGTLAGTFATQTLVNQPACASASPVVYVFNGSAVVPDDIFTGTVPPAVEPLTTVTAALNASNLYAFKIAFLPAGTYTLAFTCNSDDPAVDETALTPSPITFTLYPQPVTVTAGQTSTANF